MISCNVQKQHYIGEWIHPLGSTIQPRLKQRMLCVLFGVPGFRNCQFEYNVCIRIGLNYLTNRKLHHFQVVQGKIKVRGFPRYAAVIIIILYCLYAF